jgi:hypothetical protein
MCPQVDFDSVARKIVDGVQAGDGEALRKKFEGKSFESVRDFIEHHLQHPCPILPGETCTNETLVYSRARRIPGLATFGK